MSTQSLIERLRAIADLNSLWCREDMLDAASALESVDEARSEHDRISARHLTEKAEWRARIEVLREALALIERWELPETGKFWDDDRGRQMSYAACWGSNGERDYMRCIARQALAALASSTPESSVEAPKPVAWRCKDFADGWIYYSQESAAAAYRAETGCLVEPLYALPAPLKAEEQPS